MFKILGRFYNHAELIEQRQRWRQEGKTVVFTNGCYDLLHPGHIKTLEAARSLGDVLILALNSDDGTRRMKGPARPIVAENERVGLALALQAVDAVTLFDEETPRALIAAVLPDVLVKAPTGPILWPAARKWRRQEAKSSLCLSNRTILLLI